MGITRSFFLTDLNPHFLETLGRHDVSSFSIASIDRPYTLARTLRRLPTTPRAQGSLASRPTSMSACAHRLLRSRLYEQKRGRHRRPLRSRKKSVRYWGLTGARSSSGSMSSPRRMEPLAFRRAIVASSAPTFLRYSAVSAPSGEASSKSAMLTGMVDR